MNKYVKERGRRLDESGAPGLPKVEKIELSEKHIPLRVGLMILAFCVGIGALVYGFMQLIGHDSGWQEISVNSNADMNCGDRFTLQYDLGASGVAAGTEYRAIAALYSDSCVSAYEIFNADEHFDQVVNLYDLNHNPNTVCTVDDSLYLAFEKIQASGQRLLYYGPLYEIMENLYSCETDLQAEEFDPEYSEEIAGDFADILSFASREDQIQLQLLGDDQVCLKISEDYLAYGEEYGIEKYIDLYLMQDAFITDYLADQLIGGGYTLGTISSYDGFSRCLDGGEEGAAFPLYDLVPDEEEEKGQSLLSVCTVGVPSVNAVVSLRNFPLMEEDAYRYYVYDDGQIRSPFLGSDGLCHAALSSLTGCSEEESCSDLLLALLPYYIADSWTDEEALALKAEGCEVIYCQDGEVVSDLTDAVYSELYDKDGLTYSCRILD